MAISMRPNAMHTPSIVAISKEKSPAAENDIQKYS
jgi:hypothetical protein